MRVFVIRTYINYDRSRFLTVLRCVSYIIMSRFHRVLSNIIDKTEKYASITRVSMVNNRGVHFRRVDHPSDYVNFSIRRPCTQQCSGKCRELQRKTLGAFIISRERNSRFAWAIFNICFVTADNSHDLISRMLICVVACAQNRWLNILKPSSHDYNNLFKIVS